MTAHGSHDGLHSEQGALRGEHPGRATNPVIKVEDLAWLEFEKPDLDRAETFAHAFGFATTARTADEVQLRGAFAGSPCVIIRRGRRSRFAGAAYRAAESSDLLRLADATGTRVTRLPESVGGMVVDLTDPSGAGVRVVSDTHVLPELDWVRRCCGRDHPQPPLMPHHNEKETVSRPPAGPLVGRVETTRPALHRWSRPELASRALLDQRTGRLPASSQVG